MFNAQDISHSMLTFVSIDGHTWRSLRSAFMGAILNEPRFNRTGWEGASDLG
jgi:hypothetical protein